MNKLLPIVSMFHFILKAGKVSLLFVLLSCALSYGQTLVPQYRDSQYSHSGFVLPLDNNASHALRSVSLDLPGALGVAHQVRSAKAYTRLDLGENYKMGTLQFSVRARYTLISTRNGVVQTPAICQDCELTISNQKPEALQFTSIQPLLSADQVELLIDPATIVITPKNTYTAAEKTAIENDIKANLRVKLSYEIAYGVDASAISLSALSQLPVITGKVYDFRWNTSNIHAPNYQFQLLKLFNKQEIDLTSTTPLQKQLRDGTALVTDVDWHKALTIETQSSTPQLKLTIAQGSGFYAWRVRPIGTLYEGGIADERNYGGWTSAAVTTSITLPQDAATKGLSVFYFQDADENINHIYSRTFTEGNRVSEKITYASKLQQVKQTQAYLPSKDTTVISQTIYDYSNRPAMTTLPVPVEKGLSGYKGGFVKPNVASNRPYNAEHFDGNSNYKNPTGIDQTSTDFSYYAGTQNNVADAQNYPFSRTTYYEDGTNRVREQSGVGKRHMIGSDADKGKTVKTYYGTASEYELSRLFGEEAPSAESVIKTITTDQNNTATVTYTSKEGKVIATCLSYQDQSQDGLESLQEGPTDAVMIKDTVRTNIEKQGMLLSSKRLSLFAPTDIVIDYKLSKCSDPTDIACNTVDITCSYKLKVFIRKIDGTPFSNQLGHLDSPVIGMETGKITWQVLDSSPEFVLYSTETKVNCNASAIFNRLTLPAGTYVVEKQLVPQGQQTKVALSSKKIEAQITPLANLITKKLDTVKCDKNIKDFYLYLETLQNRITAAESFCDDPTRQACKDKLKELDNWYRADLGMHADSSFFTAQHRVLLNAIPSQGGIPTTVTLASECCGSIQIPIAYIPPFNYSDVAMRDKDGDTKYLVNPFHSIDTVRHEFYPDFEGFAYGFFWNCITDAQANAYVTANPSVAYPDNTLPSIPSSYGANAANKVKYIYHTILKHNMQGWETPGTFNLMVQHMLKDRYDCNSQGGIAKEEPASKTDCDGSTTAPCNTNGCKFYEGEELFNCWVAQLSYLRDNLGLCPNPTGATPYDEGDAPPYKVSDKMTNEGGAHDDHVDGNVNIEGGWVKKFFVKRKIKKMSARIRKMQSGDLASDQTAGDMTGESAIEATFNYHLVNEFLNCTGYRFAKILTNTPDADAAKPLAADIKSGVTYEVKVLTGKKPDETPVVNWKSYEGNDRGYYPNRGWKVEMGLAANTERLFRYVKDPVYAFKYFEYVDQSKPFVELSACYSDPNRDEAGNLICEDGDGNMINDDDDLCNFCGIGKVKCDITKELWTCGQRFSFYTMLSNFKEPIETDWSDGELLRQDYLSPGYVETNTSSEKEFFAWQSDATTPVSGEDYQALSANGAFSDGAAGRLQTKIEIDISALNTQLSKRCEDRRSEFKQILLDQLKAKCYVIGCRTSAADVHIIPEEDVEILVDAMVEQCKRRGMVTTFSLATENCRSLLKPKSEIGYTGTLVQQVTNVEYGVAGREEGCSEVYLNYRTATSNQIGITFTQHASDKLQTPTSYDATKLTILDCSGQTLTYQEYIKRKEVTAMNLQINIVSMCEPNSTLVCTPEAAGKAAVIKPNYQNNTALDASNPTSADTHQSKQVQVGVAVDENNKATYILPEATIEKQHK